jgi:hypothetical protein
VLLVLAVAISRRRDPRAAWRVALRLERQFRSAFGGPAPRSHRDLLPEAGARPAGSASPGASGPAL